MLCGFDIVLYVEQDVKSILDQCLVLKIEKET